MFMNWVRKQQYQQRMNRVVAYIERNLDSSFVLEDLCTVANFSKYHFHRQFSDYAGMTVFRLISRKRMKRAAYQLLFRKHLPITVIAFDAGFGSVEAFSKAFKREIGMSPSLFRKDKSQVANLDQLQPYLQESETEMNVEIVDFPEMRLAVLEHKGPPKMVMNSVQRFIEWRKGNHLPPSKSRTFNLMYDDPEITTPEKYRMDICAELTGILKPNDHGIVEKKIPACQCARLRHVGPWESLDESVRYLFREWLPKHNKDLMDFPLFLERVNLYPEAPQNELITDIYLPLKS
ncbi:AraC family transcriptional regulator [Temperatibacter marinus]|uniref:AraC family transcriptional regulator n=1 Tax=Temperatibacter marinus TaxID=1456591 RepID=A0AA52EFY0_9PROT|nr:AraC family transcriptional regulator [Temperatibacter marinus]WND04005.1 AraC family transcriptional regulator [Temperatibacter marinus]